MFDTPAELLIDVSPDLHEPLVNYWSDWCQACETSEVSTGISYPLSKLGRLWACSDFVARSCIKYPAAVHELIAEGLDKDRSVSDYVEIVETVLDIPFDENVLMRELRKLRQKEMMRIAWRGIDDMSSEEQILHEISDLAEIIVSKTLDYLHEDASSVFGEPRDSEGNAQQMLTLAMGKMGGRELNFSSDIDLIFCYPEGGETDGRRKTSNHEFFTRLAQRLVKALNEVTADGFVYRVDTRLRPYGDSGPLVSSFAGMEQYYQQQGREWERYAMIKAKIISGRDEDVDYLRSMLKPFIYRRYIDYSAFESIREMKLMIDAQVKRKGMQNNIKLGRGGIREIEFIGQTFQLIRGGRDVVLQERGIIPVLESLQQLKCLSESEASSLKQAYYFHRKFENRLQMEHDQQTHRIPEEPVEQQKMCLAMSMDSWDELSEQIHVHRANVGNVFQAILFAEEEEKESESGSQVLSNFWFDDGENALDIFEHWLEANAIADGEDIGRRIREFRNNSHLQYLSEEATKRLIKLVSSILGKLKSTENPALIFERMLEVLVSIAGRQVYVNLLMEYPQVLDMMISLCSDSNWFAKQLARYPILLDELIDSEYLHSIGRYEDLKIELDYLLSGVKQDDLESQMERLRNFKQAQVLKVAALDVNGRVDVTQASHTLSNVAAVICNKVLEIVWATLTEKHGVPQYLLDGELQQAKMGVIAYGKLGGDELGYGSDLDVVFIHDSQGEKQMTSGNSDGEKQLDNVSFFARVAQKVIHIMETYMHSGRLYEIDTRLRPDGRAGLMAVSIGAFEQYQLEKAWTWEHQALVRARMIAGDDQIYQEFARIRRSVLQQSRSCEKIIDDVVEMREKMREHLASKDSSEFNIKQDAGGLVDIEFIVQAGVLTHAADDDALPGSTSTLCLLERLPACGWLTQAEAEALMAAYKDFRRFVNRQVLEIDISDERSSQHLEQHRVQVSNTWNRLMIEKQEK